MVGSVCFIGLVMDIIVGEALLSEAMLARADATVLVATDLLNALFERLEEESAHGTEPGLHESPFRWLC